jgi:hypothetical protein
LTRADWQARAARHADQVERLTAPLRRRRAAHQAHPVHDFLFTYYSLSFARLAEWHPGTGVALECPPPLPGHLSRAPYRHDPADILRADPALLTNEARTRLAWIRGLLAATRDRAPQFSCHGLHEWAMVYRGTAVRHSASAPLRLPQSTIDKLVESRPLCCSHHDAFRFFPAAAKPLNRLQPSLDRRPELEQPGCVHANMDLYKWCYKSVAWCGTDLLFECFLLALDLRELDMRASPYDLRAWDYPPVRIETPEGRAEYETLQRALAARAVPLRQRLINALDAALR